jgi:cysteinyl-tRNA synthetase
MYFCGPTVYQRIHIGNARPFVISMWLKRWLERSGYDVTLAENITDINDKIYAARPGHSAKLAEQATRGTSRTRRSRPRPADYEPKATETIPEIVALIEELVGPELAYPAGGDVYFRVLGFPGLRRLSGRLTRVGSEPVRGGGANELKEDPRDFALWKAHKEARTRGGSRRGAAGRPGWHIECSAMARSSSGRPSRSTAAGSTSSSAPRERVAQSRSLGTASRSSGCTTGCCDLRARRCRSRSATSSPCARPLDEWGRETLLVYFLGGHWRKPIDYSDEVLEQAAAQAESFRNVFRGESVEGGDWDAYRGRSRGRLQHSEALAVMHGCATHDLLRRGLEVFGLESLAEVATAPAELEELARARLEARAQQDFETSDRLRDEIESAGWDVRDIEAEPGFQLVPKR